MDFLRPIGPLLLAAAALAVAGFAVIVLLKLLGRPAKNPLSTGTVAIAGLCAGMFEVAAVANSRHADEGGLLASKVESVKAFQQALFRIEHVPTRRERASITSQIFVDVTNRAGISVGRLDARALEVFVEMQPRQMRMAITEALGRAAMRKVLAGQEPRVQVSDVNVESKHNRRSIGFVAT